MPVTISPEVRDVLSRAVCQGQLIKLPVGQLDRKLYTGVDTVLKALGGKWNAKAGGHAFPFDPAPKLEEALAEGKAVKRQQRLQHFDTPLALAMRMCTHAEITPTSVCLEPSAGLGRILSAMIAFSPARMYAVEIDVDNGRFLSEMVASYSSSQRAHVIIGDFLAQDPRNLPCDVAVMNPPFSKNQDIAHVRHAFACLRGGGRLVAIMSEHAFIGQERVCQEFRSWLGTVEAGCEKIDAGTFSESGTKVATRLVSIVKRG